MHARASRQRPMIAAFKHRLRRIAREIGLLAALRKDREIMKRDASGHAFNVIAFRFEQSVDVRGSQTDHVSRPRASYISEAGSISSARVRESLGKIVPFALCG